MATATTKKKAPAAAKADSAKLEAKVFSAAGKETGTFTLPASIFGIPWNADLVHQVVLSMQSNARRGTAHAKTRAEVRGGGKKPWQQKGTGRARHGSSRSPIWKGGGVTHGPRADKSYEKKISRKMREKALLVTISRKLRDGELIFVEKFAIEAPKTSRAKQIFAALAKSFPGLQKTRNAALIAIPSADRPVMKSFSNFGNVEIMETRNLNPVAVLSKKYLVIADPSASLEVLGKKKVAKTQAIGE